MGNPSIYKETNDEKQHITLGLLAHVDAGKTTLSEAMLYLSGVIRRQGRVDHKDAYLDTFELERERGITIFSKQAVLGWKGMELTLLDTPGHVDFSAEMERTLQVLDYAVLVISGADGVQGHTMTLWRLLERYEVPVFLFVNKMDQEGTDRQKLQRELQKRLSENCLDFGALEQNADSGKALLPEGQEREALLENLAMCEEELLEHFLETEEVEEKEISRLIAQRKVFPCFFGSALKLQGVEELLDGIRRFAGNPVYGVEFGAKVYKIARDAQGNRLTYLKITGGSLRVKETLPDGQKADQIRRYSGGKFELVKEATAGMVCAVTGLADTFPGQGLGIESDSQLPILEPVLNYRILLPADCDVHQMLKKLKELEEEEPQLHIVWDERLGEIHAMLMGEVQIDILKHMIWERFHVAVEFGTGNIVYKETIEAPVEGVGHFEPLRHYAEVHLLLEPGERGSGLQFFTACSEDVLDKNWQRLILTHLEEKEHLGVLTGAPVTDMQITLLTGKAHTKHTEGGDFRQATYRAVRQGLKKAKSVLLEPYYEFRLEVPPECVGRAMSDIQQMQGEFGAPEPEEEMTVLKGTAPVAAMRDYAAQVISYTRGMGRLFCSLKGYAPCQNQEAVVEASGYDSERDLDNPTGSVFCAHGAGFLVPWYEVEEHMHLSGVVLENDTAAEDTEQRRADAYHPTTAVYTGSYEDEKELQAIFERTFGAAKRERSAPGRRVYEVPERSVQPSRKKSGEEYLLVDGYNIIFAWEDLRELAKESLGAAQGKLMDILSNYQGMRKCTLILVFDAYKVEGHREEVVKYHNIYVVYTKEAETADQYIEKTVHKIGREHPVSVATSDGLEQMIILGQGASRISAKGLREEIERASQELRQDWHQRRQSSRNYLMEQVSPEVAEYMEQVRLGKKKP
jgi:ribosomal protection tetracycline resistance protein